MLLLLLYKVCQNFHHSQDSRYSAHIVQLSGQLPTVAGFINIRRWYGFGVLLFFSNHLQRRGSAAALYRPVAKGAGHAGWLPGSYAFLGRVGHSRMPAVHAVFSGGAVYHRCHI